MGIPRHTRIIMIPDDEKGTRHYGISRPMVITLIVLAVLVAAVVAMLMVSFSGKHTERARIRELEEELAVARKDVLVAGQLKIELAEMAAIQEKTEAVAMINMTTEAVMEACPKMGSRSLKPIFR